MRIFLSILTVLTIATPAWAAPDLKGWMKEMSAKVKQIQKQLPDASLEEDTVRLCDQLKTDVESARQLLPRSVTDLPADAQEAAAKRYDGLMGQLLGTIATVRQALVDHDHTRAAKLMRDILAIKSDGHKQFK